jgi:hypothetical protein
MVLYKLVLPHSWWDKNFAFGVTLDQTKIDNCPVNVRTNTPRMPVFPSFQLIFKNFKIFYLKLIFFKIVLI